MAVSHPSDLLSAPASAAERSEKITMSDLLALWIGERKPPPRSQVAYRGKVNRLVDFLGHDDAGKISDRDMIRYKEHLLKDPALSQKTVAGHLDDLAGHVASFFDSPLFDPPEAWSTP